MCVQTAARQGYRISHQADGDADKVERLPEGTSADTGASRFQREGLGTGGRPASALIRDDV